jgi:hypothetical protein
MKLFLGDKRVLGTGVHQCLSYARDRVKGSAYLVVMDLSPRTLQLHTDGEADSVPKFLDVGGVRVYLIPIRALPPDAPASKAGKPKPIKVTRGDLIHHDADE